MLKPLLTLLLFAQVAFAQSPATPNDAKAWMIQHFKIPATAKITYWFSTGNPVESCAITWEIGTGPSFESHTRAYNFQTKSVTNELDM